MKISTSDRQNDRHSDKIESPLCWLAPDNNENTENIRIFGKKKYVRYVACVYNHNITKSVNNNGEIRNDLTYK